jgi:hypothetical protein
MDEHPRVLLLCNSASDSIGNECLLCEKLQTSFVSLFCHSDTRRGLVFFDVFARMGLEPSVFLWWQAWVDIADAPMGVDEWAFQFCAIDFWMAIQSIMRG